MVMSVNPMRIPNVLSIAGSDPSGGAGIQADLKTFAALDVYGMAVITAATVQNTQGVQGVLEFPSDFVEHQLISVFEDIEIDAVKIGMLADSQIISCVADVLVRYQTNVVVFDPVMVSTSGNALISGDAIDAMKEKLIPLCDVITPNIPEAEKLLRKSVLEMEQSAVDLQALGCPAVYLKGGHLKGARAQDVLAYMGGILTLDAPRVDTKNTHGTGCTLSSAIAAYMARGFALPEACAAAKEYVTGALIHGVELSVGKGNGPVHHGFFRGHKE